MESPSERHVQAALVIQRWLRGCLGRRAASHARSQHEAVRRAALLRRAARVQQSLIASERTRNRLEGLDGAEFLETWSLREMGATTVQKYVRGWRVRKNSRIHDFTKQRNQAAAVIQKYVRGYMVRHQSGEHNQLGADVRSRSPSPTGMLGMQLEHGMLAVSAKRQQELTEQIEKRLQSSNIENENPSQPQPLKEVLEQSHANSGLVPKALARANKAREKCDHLVRTLQTRLELPCDDGLEPSAYPRPPPGSRREELANMAHAMSMSDVVDPSDMSDIESKRWAMAMQTNNKASSVWPWRDRDDSLDKVCKLRWELLAKEEQARM